MQKALDFIPSTRHGKQAWYFMAVNIALMRARHEHHEFKAIIIYMMSFGRAHAVWDCLKKEKGSKIEESEFRLYSINTFFLICERKV